MTTRVRGEGLFALPASLRNALLERHCTGKHEVYNARSGTWYDADQTSFTSLGKVHSCQFKARIDLKVSDGPAARVSAVKASHLIGEPPVAFVSLEKHRKIKSYSLLLASQVST